VKGVSETRQWRVSALNGRSPVFSCAGAADQHDVLCTVHELAAMQLPHSGLVDLTGREVEAGESLVSREACGLQVIGNGRTSRSVKSAFSNWASIGTAASNADARAPLSPGPMAFHGSLHQVCNSLGHAVHLQAARAMMMMAPLAGS